MTYYFWIVFLLVILFVTGCGNNSQTDTASRDSITAKNRDVQQPPSSHRIATKVYIDETGKISANGNLVSLAILDSNFSKLNADSGIVYYARANGAGKPTAQAMGVMRLIVKHELPVQLYTDSNFTTVVDLKIK